MFHRDELATLAGDRERRRRAYMGVARRWVMVWAGTVGLLGCVHTRPAAVPRPLLQNGGFELASAAAPTLPAWWMEDATSVSYRLDASVAHGGQRSLRVEFAEEATKRGYSGVIATLDVSALRGQRVRFEGFLKRSSEASKVGLWLRLAGTDGLYVNSYEARVTVSDGWARHRLEVELPADATTLMLGAAIHEAPGVMWVDDLSFTVSGRR
ncbi:MAG: hypothetical protein ACK6DP_19800 [Gemmatimonas sp.]|jgi:hypothetical protein|uniref:hypothetical protein n=1 Tax=Gemmatimonas sp. TaxID=1962908 RepID=UPI00391FB24D|nr:hypothetical protein [Gemmatimonadota bacterium]